MSKKNSYHLNATVIALDALVIFLMIYTVFLGRASQMLSWSAILLFVAFLLLFHAILVIIFLLRKPILREEWYFTIFGALGSVCAYLDEVQWLKYLQKRKYKQNVPSRAVVITGYPDFSHIEAWIRPHCTSGELIALCELLEARETNFSFYTRAGAADLRSLMADTSVSRVYFVGHGSRKEFLLSNGIIIQYSEFTKVRHEKEFVHQIHCGHGEGERLIDCVVPEENRGKCFFFPEVIRSVKIIAELKKLLGIERAVAIKKAAD